MICAERIGVSLIRLRLPALRAIGIVRSFAAADQLLIDWARHLQAFECGFELVYLDGQVLRGALAYRRKGSSRPSLSRHIRKLAQGAGAFAERTDDFEPAAAIV